MSLTPNLLRKHEVIIAELVLEAFTALRTTIRYVTWRDPGGVLWPYNAPPTLIPQHKPSTCARPCESFSHPFCTFTPNSDFKDLEWSKTSFKVASYLLHFLLCPKHPIPLTHYLFYCKTVDVEVHDIDTIVNRKDVLAALTATAPNNWRSSIWVIGFWETFSGLQKAATAKVPSPFLTRFTRIEIDWSSSHTKVKCSSPTRYFKWA